ncbi:uncharacterized protein LOC112550299 [Alligator sinensis]|uniref:Uncharacterized protein LOC112550299 n=1 Tax=Alligator sinensis TaxID=38654 RepID=A0A3Q0GPF8_ALLSI|nr:uncharacterized protein LOC112550299 [Alligator sinensis]
MSSKLDKNQQSYRYFIVSPLYPMAGSPRRLRTASGSRMMLALRPGCAASDPEASKSSPDLKLCPKPHTALLGRAGAAAQGKPGPQKISAELQVTRKSDCGVLICYTERVFLEGCGAEGTDQHGAVCLQLQDFQVPKSLDVGIEVDVVYLDFMKAFDTVSHPMLVNKLNNCGTDAYTVSWMANWLDGCTQRVMMDRPSSKTWEQSKRQNQDGERGIGIQSLHPMDSKKLLRTVVYVIAEQGA